MATARRPISRSHSSDHGGSAAHVWVGRYAIAAGEVLEQSPWLVDRLRVREEETVRLLVLAEPADERSAEFCAEVADAVAALFGRESLSLTGGLLRALRLAHDNLAEWNRRSLREHRVAVGVTCVAVRDGVATLAQAGRGIAYLHGPDGFRRLSTEGTEGARPLGGEEPIEPAFHSIPLEERQLLLLTSTAETRMGSPAAVGEALERGPERALGHLFLRTRDVPDMAAVLVADLDAPESAQPQPLPSFEDEAVEGRRVIPVGPAPVEGDVESRAARPLPLPRRDRGDLPRLRRSSAQAADAPAFGLPWRLVAIAGAAALALALIAWTFGPGLLGEDRAITLDRAVAEAGAYLAAAEQAADPAERRGALASALAEAERARSIDPEDARVAALEARARSALAVLDAVVEVRDLERVIDFGGRITAPLRPQALAAGGGWLWLLDSELGRIVRIDPGAGADPQEVYRAGERYEGTSARMPLAIVWEPLTRRLLVLDSARTLFALEPARAVPRPLPLRDAAQIRSVAALAAYAGNLYVLDPDGGEVWRYLPAAEGFDSERAGLLGGAEIRTAEGLAVDGELYVLDGGALRRFRQGREEAPLLQGIDRLPQAPAGVVEDPVRGLLYVADRGYDRIVVSDRSGAFVRQFRHPAFFDLRGLALAPDGATLYVLTGDGVSAFDPLQ